MNSTYPTYDTASMPRHSNNVAAMASGVRPEIRINKNPHAVALGKMTSSEKAAAAQQNGKKGGRPEGS